MIEQMLKTLHQLPCFHLIERNTYVSIIRELTKRISALEEKVEELQNGKV